MLMLGVTVLQRAVGFGRSILFCRWLEPEELGQWGMAFNFLMLAAPLAVLGLPGSFGRYVEYYRQRGQLRTFVRRTTIWTALLGGGAVLLVAIAAPYVSRLVFGRADSHTLMTLLALALSAIILHHSLESLFTALRLARVVTCMQLCQSVAFAALGITLLLCWRATAESVVLAYGAACLLSSSGTLLWAKQYGPTFSQSEEPLPQKPFWSKLMRFAAWVWVANLLTNLFATVDHYMLLHCSKLPAEEALAQIGFYHSSRVVPLLLVAVAGLLTSMILPHLSHDWECGRRREVSARVNLTLKLSAIVALLGGICVLLMAPWLFEVAFQGRYAGGLAVLPWTLVYCVWFGLTMMAGSYLLCVEKARLCSLPLAIGLAGNVVLNLILLPRYGLLGAVLATTAANGIALGLTLWLNRIAEWKVESATLVLCATPIVLGCGVWYALAMLVIVAICCVSTDQILTSEDKRQLSDVAAIYLKRWKARRLVVGED